MIADLLAKHFGKAKPSELSVSERQFPYRGRADLQRGADLLINGREGVKSFCGVSQMLAFEGLDLASLIAQDTRNQAMAVPPQYEEVDIGEDKPVRCLKVGLWLLEQTEGRFAVLLSPVKEHGRAQGMRLQIATLSNDAGLAIVEELFEAMEKTISNGRSYRGKILSLEEERSYSGRSSGIKVHKLRPVTREQLILPKATLMLLERNVIQFVQHREKLAHTGLSTRKGILFYGPPGTGKSHTIRYLAGALPRHTMLLISAEQVQLLGDYMALARLLQPSVVVIEDVDLIARQRESLVNPRDQALLNALLNEMDGLKETADILFILTTNQPEVLEAALMSRPGRVDQAIEFPLPDAIGREKLVRLYAGLALVGDEIVQSIVNKTDGVSAAFIKELMRRSVQFQLEGTPDRTLAAADVENALEEMLFSSGTLNVKLLGGNRRIGFDTPAHSPAVG